MVHNLDVVSKLLEISCVSQIQLILLWNVLFRSAMNFNLGMLQRNKPQHKDAIVRPDRVTWHEMMEDHVYRHL
jgi:hypothetical protein